MELHGDRGGYDDPALVTGIGSIDGMSFMFMGHQKGRNTKENIYRNFAMPTPNGYAFQYNLCNICSQKCIKREMQYLDCSIFHL